MTVGSFNYRLTSIALALSLSAACSQAKGGQRTGDGASGQATPGQNPGSTAPGSGRTAGPNPTGQGASAAPPAASGDSTPVLVVFGGYTSCFNTDGSPADPSSQQMSQLFNSVLAAVKKSAKLAPAYLLGCYGIDNQNIIYSTSVKGAPRTAPVATMVDDLAAFLQTLHNPVVYMIGHSYGGWTALQTLLTLTTPVRLGGLITLDPISMVDCTPQAYVASSLGQQPAPGCLRAPTDFGDASLIALRKRLGFWANFYETGAPSLHSGPLTDAGSNTKQSYTGQGFAAHNAFTADKTLFTQLAKLITGAMASAALTDKAD